ncbi:RNA-binding KH domain-containing protein PEPPER-like [Vicia villosa]|uniref:RNA-binding KH domain-containing protein PEPPER-like n=1 Tax=Vicia villosa TaxID=3911 RepID=UPI00273B237D|nr:RNA-binding KH domain-containing protein PEPPER-like [Vicia villosa]
MATIEPPQNGTATATITASNPLPPDNPSAAQPLTTDTDATAVINSSSIVNESAQETETVAETGTEPTVTPPEKRWSGWPGDCVFRLIVPVGKVGSIIGRKGELIKKLCEETKARVRVLDADHGTPDRVILISGKEELESAISPAMDAAIRIFKRVSGLSEIDSEVKNSAGVTACSIRLLVPSTQAISLIGKQGSLIRSIQESSSASVRVLSVDEVHYFATAEERIVDLQGEALNVLKALEAVIGHLRKFLVDHSVVPLFEKTYNASITQQERQAETWSDKPSLNTISQTSMFSDIPLPSKRDSVFADRESHLDSLLSSSSMPHYGQDSSLSGVRSSTLSRVGAPIVTTVIQTMQIPLSYAEDIIGIQGTNIDYIRRTSGAILTVQESRVPDEIVVEIKGTSSQVQTAQQLIQEVISSRREPITNSYGRLDASRMDAGPRSYSQSSYSQLGNSSRIPPSLPSQPYSSYGASGLGDYSTFRL